MRPKNANLLEQHLIFFSEQMGSIFKFHDFVGARSLILLPFIRPIDIFML